MCEQQQGQQQQTNGNKQDRGMKTLECTIIVGRLPGLAGRRVGGRVGGLGYGLTGFTGGIYLSEK